MKPNDFINQIDDSHLVAAIADAERRTSGEIRVFISRRTLKSGEDIIARAQARFDKLGMTRTLDRNAVLIYFMPIEQRYAVIGDSGIHEKCGPAFWQEVTAAMAPHLASGHFTKAIVTALTQIGETLAHHFPRQSDDRDELKNEVLGD